MKRRRKLRGRHVPLKRAPLARSSTLRRRVGLASTAARRDDDVEAKRAFQTAVFQASGGRCVVSGDPADDAHHVVPQQAIRRYVRDVAIRDRLDPAARADLLRRLRWDARNGVALSRSVHDGHTRRTRPIPLRFVPDSAIAFAREIGLDYIIERDYPEEESDAA